MSGSYGPPPVDEPCYAHTNRCQSYKHCLYVNSYKLRLAKMTLSTIELAMSHPLNDAAYTCNRALTTNACIWHGSPCTSVDSCLTATTRHLIQANAIIIYLRRKQSQLHAQSFGLYPDNKNKGGNSSDGPIIGYIASQGNIWVGAKEN